VTVMVWGFSEVALRALCRFGVSRFQSMGGFQKLGSFSNCSPESSDGLSCMEQYSKFAHVIHTVK
jgi:hypothetical protein